MRFLLLLVAAVIAVFAGMAALQLSNKNTPETPVASTTPTQSIATVNVLVARNPIPAGTVITATMLDTQPWPENLVLKQFIVGGSSDADIVGKVTRAPFQEREPLISSKLASINDAGFLAAGLPAGMRAVSIATDAVAGVAGFVYPGDHVDLIFTHNLNDAGKGKGDSDRPSYSEVLVADAPVLAINLREQNSLPLNTSGQASTAPSSITLQVSPLEAENIRLAEKVGTLSISLRSLKDANNKTGAPPTNLSGLTRVQGQMPQTDNSVKVIKR